MYDTFKYFTESSKTDEVFTSLTFIFSRGCDINAYDNENQTPLMLAVGNGHKETVEILLSHDADLSIVDLYEKSVIYCAAEENAIEVLKVFYFLSFNHNVYCDFQK